MQSPKTISDGTLSANSEDAPDIQRFLQDFLADNRVHAKSLISTFFGDVVIPVDGFTWVETMAAALEPLGVNERLVRTSLFRLREEGWVTATRAGRKSYYQLTESAQSQTRLAEQLIYYHDTPQWDGAWTLLFFVLEPIDAEVRRELVQELKWIGFGRVIKHVWAHPGDKRVLVAERIERLGLKGKVICMRCENIFDLELGFTANDRQLAALCLPISEAETGYQKFVKDFSPLLTNGGDLAIQLSNAQALSLRLLVMDEFRRVILRDHHLPLELLPQDWAGKQAYQLCAAIYRKIQTQATDYYCKLQAQAGEVEQTAPSQDYSGRFAPI